MSFQLSPCVIDKNIFLVRRSRLEGRLDPNTYHPNRLFAINRVKRCGFKTEKLGRFASFKKIIVTSISETDTYVGLENIESNTGCYFATKNKTNISSALVFKKGQVLFPKLRPYLNKVFYANFDGICSTEFHVLDNHVVSNKYLAYFLGLDVVVTQTTLLMSGNTLPRLQTEDIKKILIPILPPEIQNQIVAKMDAAHFAKKQKEANAQLLLEGIDDYLLGELGIELSLQEENTIYKRIFYRKFSKISGRRFDASVHHRDYSLNTKYYLMERLIDCVFINPPTSFHKFKSDSMATFIPMESVSDEYGEADLSQCRTVAESGGYTKFKENDLIWAKITPCMQNGKSAVVSQLKNLIGFGSTEFHVFRAREGIDIRYIHALLRLKSLRDYARLYFSGSAGHQRVSDDFFKRLIIPKPPIEKQIQIAEHISTIRDQAKRLKQEAKAELEQTKKEVEAMILGD